MFSGLPVMIFVIIFPAIFYTVLFLAKDKPPHGNVRLCLTPTPVWGQFPLMPFFNLPAASAAGD